MQQDEPIDLSINSKKVDVSFKGTDIDFLVEIRFSRQYLYIAPI